MNIAVTAQPGLAKITPYKSGDASIAGRRSAIKLSANENPFGPSPMAVTAFKNAMENLGQYPASDPSELRWTIQEAHGFDAERIVCGNGSDEILGLLAQAFAGPDSEVIHTKHGFLMYPIFARSVGAEPVEADEPERRVDVDAILAACSKKTRLVYIANPSNPTGNMLDNRELKRLADGLPANVILVIDGAYAEFAAPPDCSGELAAFRSNVVTTRTFSKIHGLAALRVGYGFGSQPIMDAIGRIRAPFNVNGPAQAAAIAALQDQDHVRLSQLHNAEWRQRLKKQLEDCGLKADASSANFVLARFAEPQQAHDCDQWLRGDGIIVRRMENYQLPHCLRISIGSESANRAVTESIATFMKQKAL